MSGFVHLVTVAVTDFNSFAPFLIKYHVLFLRKFSTIKLYFTVLFKVGNNEMQ